MCILDDAGFDAFVEEQCVPRSTRRSLGRPSLAPGFRYFRLLLLALLRRPRFGSARWRRRAAADSLSVRSFLHLELHDPFSPDHSTISRTRRLIDLEMFTRRCSRGFCSGSADGGLVTGQTIGIDATTLEANAALRSIVRRDTGDIVSGVLDEARRSGLGD